jgi:hypothetical protein
MLKKQILRIEVDPDAFAAIEAEAFLRRSTMKAVASEILRSNTSQEAIEIARKRDNSVIASLGHHDETPNNQMIEEPECSEPEHDDPKPTKRTLVRDQAAVAKIKELWVSGERNAAEIARQIEYPRATVHENIKKLIQKGTLQDDKEVLNPDHSAMNIEIIKNQP